MERGREGGKERKGKKGEKESKEEILIQRQYLCIDVGFL